MIYSVMSLDVSAAKTGWCYTNDGICFTTGVIETSPKLSRSTRLLLFFNKLNDLLVLYKPSHIVMEDTFAGKNTKTLKILSEFAGVAKLACIVTSYVDPVVVANTTVKSFYKTRTKEKLFNFICDIFNKKDLTFKKDNDKIDALAQLLYYWDEVLGLYAYKVEKEYGFLYRSHYATQEDN